MVKTNTPKMKYPKLYDGGYSHTMRNGNDVYHASSYDNGEVTDFINQVKLLEKQHDELLVEFEKRVKHNATWCAKMRDGNLDCDCGRDEAIAKAGAV